VLRRACDTWGCALADEELHVVSCGIWLYLTQTRFEHFELLCLVFAPYGLACRLRMELICLELLQTLASDFSGFGFSSAVATCGFVQDEVATKNSWEQRSYLNLFL
jgi:hypothetical protein